MKTISKGDNISVEYTGRFENGEIFDTSKHGDHSHPLEFEVGAGRVIKGFDDGVLGLKEGDKKKITIKPSEAYGELDERLKQEIPKKMIAEQDKISVGMMLMLNTPDGNQFPAKIVEVKDETFVLDMNHPLAGKTLIFDIEVVKIEKKGEWEKTEEEECDEECDCDDCDEDCEDEENSKDN
jgi:FKBP-type peptidyl-prolyl cis-trans isomerase 2